MAKRAAINSAIATLVLLSGALIGCMSLSEMAPPVDGDHIVAMAKPYGGDPATLQRGRYIYITKCNGCHSIEPIERYSLDQWEMILPDMSEETKLNPAETSDLEHYVMTIRRMQQDGLFAVTPDQE